MQSTLRGCPGNSSDVQQKPGQSPLQVTSEPQAKPGQCPFLSPNPVCSVCVCVTSLICFFKGTLPVKSILGFSSRHFSLDSVL